jgi:hypothetical protein
MVRIRHHIRDAKYTMPDAVAASVIYNTTRHQNKSHGIIAAAREVCNTTCCVWFSVRVYEVPSEQSGPSETPGCTWRKLGLLVIYFLFTSWFLLVSIALTVTNRIVVCLFASRVGQLNRLTYGAALTSPHSSLGIPDPQCHRLTLDQSVCLWCNSLCYQLDYPSYYSGLPNLRCLNCFQVHYAHHFCLYDDWVFGFSRHLIF